MGRNTFINPATGERYMWQRNHSEEESEAAKRLISELPSVANGWKPKAKVIRQQGSKTPKRLRYTGRAPQSLHAAFLRFFELSATQTIHFIHFDGTGYEVQVVSYEPEKKYIRGYGPSRYVWDYTIEMQVIKGL